MDYPEDKKRKSTTIRIPRGLKKSIEEFVKTGAAQKAVLEAAVRRLLEYYGFIETFHKENDEEHPE